MQRLESCPQMELSAINPTYDAIEYDDNTDLLDAWLKGRTGYPMIDACMRCLRETGFINFRMRAMVVSLHALGCIFHGGQYMPRLLESFIMNRVFIYRSCKCRQV